MIRSVRNVKGNRFSKNLNNIAAARNNSSMHPDPKKKSWIPKSDELMMKVTTQVCPFRLLPIPPH